jgi:hypothetical protein
MNGRRLEDEDRTGRGEAEPPKHSHELKSAVLHVATLCPARKFTHTVLQQVEISIPLTIRGDDSLFVSNAQFSSVRTVNVAGHRG